MTDMEQLLEQLRVDPNALFADLWKQGEIDYIFDAHARQKEMFAFLDSAPPKSVNYIEATRGFGKTSSMCLWLSKRAYTKKVRILFGSSIKDQVEELSELFLEPLFDMAPPGMRPKKIKSKYKYEFPNGSYLRLIGLDKDKLRSRRGPKYDIGYLDEIAMIDNPYDMVFSALYPMVERCGGIIICTTTPPVTFGHNSTKIKEHCMIRNRYFRRDVYQCDLYPPSRIAELKEQLGPDSIAWRREYELIDETDKSRQVVPEFNETQHVVESWVRPEFYHWYVFMDVGFVDFTHILFCYWDFNNAKLIVEDEICRRGVLAGQIAELIKAKELELNHPGKPAQRMSDNDPQQITELGEHGIHFSPKIEFDRDASINRLRSMFSQDRIRIHAKCTKLIAMLKYGIKTKSGKDYERIDEELGHLDGIDAMRIGIRMVNYESNPYPPYHGIDLSRRIITDEMLNQKTNKWDELSNV